MDSLPHCSSLCHLRRDNGRVLSDSARPHQRPRVHGAVPTRSRRHWSLRYPQRTVLRRTGDIQRAGDALPRLPRRARVQGQGHPGHWSLVFGGRRRLSVLEVRLQVGDDLAPQRHTGLQMAGEHQRSATSQGARENVNDIHVHQYNRPTTLFIVK